MQVAADRTDASTAIQTESSRNFCVFGTQPIYLADHIFVARHRGEDVEAFDSGRRCGGLARAVGPAQGEKRKKAVFGRLQKACRLCRLDDSATVYLFRGLASTGPLGGRAVRLSEGPLQVGLEIGPIGSPRSFAQRASSAFPRPARRYCRKLARRLRFVATSLDDDRMGALEATPSVDGRR